ncbi:MAG: pesticin C-terminus-like muramidase [Bacteroidota bacterium]
MPKFSDKALRLILDSEGMHYKPEWPGEKSGITIGIGYDLGYQTVDMFESDWGNFLTRLQTERLRAVVGLREEKARKRVEELSDIKIRRVDAEEVFIRRSLPVYFERARQAYPGLDNLPLDAQGAILSLVYNRGTSMFDKPGEDRRKEMRAIRDAVAEGDLQEIADQLRSMKRLWDANKSAGLLTRREAEAALVESCIA